MRFSQSYVIRSLDRNAIFKRSHTVLAIQAQYPHEIEAAQQKIKERIALGYAHKALGALDKIGQRIAAERSPLKQFDFYDRLADRIRALDIPVRKHPQPMSMKLAALRRAKRDKLSLPSA